MTLKKAKPSSAPAKNKGTAFSNLLFKARNDSGLTLRNVQRDTGISNSQLYMFESGKSYNPAVRTIFKLVRFYDIPLKDLADALAKDDGE